MRNTANNDTRKVKAPRSRDRDPRLRRRLSYAGAGLGVILTTEFLSWFPDVVERYYTNGAGQWIVRALAHVSGMVPFSLVELVLWAFMIWLLLPVPIAALDVARRRRGLRNVAVCGAARTAGAVGILVTLFYVLWGFNYARADFARRAGWNSARNDFSDSLNRNANDELFRLCAQLVFITNHYYEVANGCRDLGRPSAPGATFDELDRSVDRAYVRVAELLELHPTFALSRGPAKPVSSSRRMSTLGVAGFYFPFTGEANFNQDAPSCQRPFTIAHEKAHQRCVTGEDEANFIGYLACVTSDDPYVRYSGYLFAQRQLLSELLKVDRERAMLLLEWRYRGVQRDVDWANLYWGTFRGAQQSVGRAVNNVYLKANRVSGGIKSYQMSARLLVLFAEQNGGSVIVGDARDTAFSGAQAFAGAATEG